MAKPWRAIVDSGTTVAGLAPGDAKHVRVANVGALLLTVSTGWWVPMNPCEARGVIEVKGKGPMETWFIA